MGNHHSASHTSHKIRKNVHWKSAGRPAVPGKPDIVPLKSDDEPNSITLRWTPSIHDGGAPMQGYQVECNRLGTSTWIRTAPAVVQRPELILTGLEAPHRYQFRVAAINIVGRSDYSELSDVLNITSDRGTCEPPIFIERLSDVTALENEKTEFRVKFNGAPTPAISWFKDGYEIFSSRRTAITTNDEISTLIFHQILSSDEGEIKCTATNRAGHAVTKATLSLEAAPKLRYPRQYEDGLLYEIRETVFLKTSIVGKPTPNIEWYHDGQIIHPNERIEITNTPKFSMLKIQSAQRSDRGEYQIQATNIIGEDTASFLVTITAPPDPPRFLTVNRQVDKSVTLAWEAPEDDGGCRIGNYIIEYYRNGWNVWLKATTSRKTTITLFDLIEGSEYKFRVKAESPYGMSAPSTESQSVKIPGRAVDMEFLEVESRIINKVLLKEDGEEPAVSPAPRRRKQQQNHVSDSGLNMEKNNNMMINLIKEMSSDFKADQRKSFQLDLEDALSPPQISLSTPDLCSRCILPFKSLRNAVSSTELLHERAMARFFKAVAMKEKIESKNTNERSKKENILKANTGELDLHSFDQLHNTEQRLPKVIPVKSFELPEIIIKSESDNSNNSPIVSNNNKSELVPESDKWQNISYEEDYTASTVTTDGEYSEEESIQEEEDSILSVKEEETYNPRDKLVKTLSKIEENKKEFILPDPTFIPKPILKRRGNNSVIQMDNLLKETKPKKDEKTTLFKKITKMPVQNPFSFSKILKKENVAKITKPIVSEDKPVIIKESKKSDDDLSDGGKTVIDYYSNIVKEYGNQKKPNTTLYLKTEELKVAAEKQQIDKNQHNSKIKNITTKKDSIKNKSNVIKTTAKSVSKIKTDVSDIANGKLNTTNEKNGQQIVIKKAQRATIVIPIDFEELEEKAKINVKTAIDYIVDLCLLCLAFWVYFFKDERLAIPFVVLIIYRQLQETIFHNIPEWVKSHTPTWLKKNS